ncbi:hypothetical protein AVEN_224082-1 [Araneus ventricosus]|uniref:DUF19 domain-containing protein n=1 Tax=Araneus ventricosus TaxID=182803 RepID=A0A4Y2IWM6_ARAVE|nr:hypothetical protein AVEN_224082-1 [Araneus ventricosus]
MCAQYINLPDVTLATSFTQAILPRILSGNMKSSVLFVIAALFVSVHCDQKCYRAVIKECVRKAVPSDRMTFCEDMIYQLECIWQSDLFECNYNLWSKALNLKSHIKMICDLEDKEWFDIDKACYKRVLSDSVCVEPIIEAVSDLNTTEDIIRANKKVCNLFEPYSNCVYANVGNNCNGTEESDLWFDVLYDPLRKLSNSVCKKLVLPANEKDSRTDNLGMINVYEAVVAIFDSA